MRTVAHALVKMTVESQQGAWGGDCPLDQIRKQAAEGAVAQVRNLVRERRTGIRIIGDPHVTVVLVDPDDEAAVKLREPRGRPETRDTIVAIDLALQDAMEDAKVTTNRAALLELAELLVKSAHSIRVAYYGTDQPG